MIHFTETMQFRTKSYDLLQLDFNDSFTNAYDVKTGEEPPEEGFVAQVKVTVVDRDNTQYMVPIEARQQRQVTDQAEWESICQELYTHCEAKVKEVNQAFAIWNGKELPDEPLTTMEKSYVLELATDARELFEDKGNFMIKCLKAQCYELAQ